MPTLMASDKISRKSLRKYCDVRPTSRILDIEKAGEFRMTGSEAHQMDDSWHAAGSPPVD